MQSLGEIFTRRNRRSELLAVLKEEYSQRAMETAPSETTIPLPSKPPQPLVPFVAQWLSPEPTRSLTGLNDVLSAVEQSRRQVLIVGEPGAGKTTLLVALANQLVQKAIGNHQQPIPVILDLSNWLVGKSLADWIVEELTQRYHPLPADQVTDWLNNGQLLPLLDGLDELKAQQDSAITAINEWVQRRSVEPDLWAGVVVCWWWAKYIPWVAEKGKILEQQIKHHIELLPLDEATIFTHLHDCKRDFLWEEIQTDQDGFLRLAKSPLFLSLMVATYQKPGQCQPKLPQGLGSLETYYLDCRDRLFDDYLESRLHSNTHSQWKTADIHRYLVWLARFMRDRDQTEFLIEYMQPSLLGGKQGIRQYRLLFGLITGLIVGMIIGLITGLMFGIIAFQTLGLMEGMVLGLQVGLGVGLVVWLVVGLTLGLTHALFFGFASHQTQEQRVERDTIRPREVIDLSPENCLSAVIGTLISGVITGATFGLIYMVLGRPMIFLILGAILLIWNMNNQLIDELKMGKVQWHSCPNGRIVKGVKSFMVLSLISLPVSLTIGLVLMMLIVGDFTHNLMKLMAGSLTNNSAISVTLAVIIAISLAAFFRFAASGYTLVQHYCLRWLLERQQVIPKDYEAFLIYAAEQLQLLKRSGGQFRFHHNLLRERIAN